MYTSRERQNILILIKADQNTCIAAISQTSNRIQIKYYEPNQFYFIRKRRSQLFGVFSFISTFENY